MAITVSLSVGQLEKKKHCYSLPSKNFMGLFYWQFLIKIVIMRGHTNLSYLGNALRLATIRFRRLTPKLGRWTQKKARKTS